MSSAATSAKPLRRTLQIAERMPLECEPAREARKSDRAHKEVGMMSARKCLGRREAER
jgi:hypothetical protein